MRDRLVREWLEKLQILVILFDLDDTILATNQLFRDKIDQCLDFIVSQVPDLDRQKLPATGLRPLHVSK